MGSSAGYAKPLSRFMKPVMLPVSVAALAYGLFKGRSDVARLATNFLTGPGNKSRIFALLMVVLNWKSLPLAWTVRVFNTMIMHLLVRKLHTHGPDKLFHPAITQTHVTLLEVDYNIHKSNSTYFADLDVSRSHLVSHLMARGIRLLGDNAHTRLVLDPSDPAGQRAAPGRFGVSLGAVQCTFKRELKPYQPYELWSRVLSWDRKWLYMVTHFVEKGAVRPRSWDAAGFGLTRGDGDNTDWERKIYASAVSKYVFKMGRLTVHPAVVIGASGLLPERPGGWVNTESAESSPAESVLGPADEEEIEADGAEAVWDWRKTEAERLKGMEFAAHFAAMDGLVGQFDGGENGALARFSLG